MFTLTRQTLALILSDVVDYQNGALAAQCLKHRLSSYGLTLELESYNGAGRSIALKGREGHRLLFKADSSWHSSPKVFFHYGTPDSPIQWRRIAVERYALIAL